METKYKLQITVKGSAQPMQDVKVTGGGGRFDETKLCHERSGYVDFEVPEGEYDIAVKDDDGASGGERYVEVKGATYRTIWIKR